MLGVIRPVTEQAGGFTRSGHIGLLGTTGTVRSNSYAIEINKFFPHLTVVQESCPLWVPLIENNELLNEGARFFVGKHVNVLFAKDPWIDAVILGCTHYPLLMDCIQEFLPRGVRIINQGEIVAQRLKEYLQRHQEIDTQCTKNGRRDFFTTDSSDYFNDLARIYFGAPLQAARVELS